MIVQPYLLTTASIPYGVEEMRILMRIMQHVKAAKEEGRKKIVLASSCLSNYHRPRIKENLEKVRDLDIVVHTKEQEDFCFRLIKDFFHDAKKGQVIFYLDEDVMDLLTYYKHGFTQYDIDVAFRIMNKNLLQWYWYISHFRNMEYINVSYDTAWRILMQMRKGKTKVICCQSVRNYATCLKECGDVYYNVSKTFKLGRCISGWRLSIVTREKSARYEKGKLINQLSQRQRMPKKEAAQFLEWLGKEERFATLQKGSEEKGLMGQG